MSPLSMQPMRLTSRSRLRAACPTQRGAATLVVVMVLFFIVALVAAYTSRNLIFEQRTAANQYRATQAFEAAEAGLEWGLAMLNSGRIDAACQPHVDPATADESFRLRYLDIVDSAPDAGRVTPRLRADGQPRQTACVFDGTGWQCSCPVDTAPTLAEPVGPGPYPAFVLRFFENNPAYPTGSGPYPPGVVRIQSTGCTRLDADTICAAAATSGDGRATVTSLAALKSALATPPAAAVTVRGNLNRADAATWEVVNADLASGGLTVHAGGTVMPGTWLKAGRPGTPEGQSFFENDTQMQVPNMNDAEQMFTSVFGIGSDTYRLQPAAVFLDCAVDDCAAATVRDLALLNPGRVLWINGDFNIDIADPIGTVNFPAMLVVTGNISISDPGASLNGLLYMAGASWQHVGGGHLSLRGALISQAEPDLTVSGADANAALIEYDRELLDRLHWTHGSFVRVPGSWRDF